MPPCSVCSAEESKYKCAACKAQSCSLLCFKTHAAQCTTDPPDHKSKPADSIAEVVGTEKKSIEGQPHQPSLAELNELFKTYPTLKDQLRQIYMTTQRPEERHGQSNNYRGRFSGRGRGRGSHASNGVGEARHWTPEKGFDRGLTHLQRALEQESEKGAALQVFAGAVLKTRNPEEPGKADAFGP